MRELAAEWIRFRQGCSVPMDTSIASVIFRPGIPKYLLVVACTQMWDLPTFE